MCVDVCRSQWFNPYYQKSKPYKAVAYLTLGLHCGTDLLGKASRLTHPVSRTAAKVLAFAVDLFTAVICNPFALLYNCSVAPIANTIIKIANRKTIKASKSWEPTSYKAIAIDLALVASVAALGVLGYKHFFQVVDDSPKPSTLPESWKDSAMKIGATTKDGTVNFLKTCFWGDSWSQRVPKLMFGGCALVGGHRAFVEIFGRGRESVAEKGALYDPPS
jgi:hypothetical protein